MIKKHCVKAPHPSVKWIQNGDVALTFFNLGVCRFWPSAFSVGLYEAMSFLTFEPVIEHKLFSELFGFVISDPLKLESFHEKATLGLDLLDLYTTTSEGDRVAMEGAAIPILGVGAGYYPIIFREATTPSLLHEAPVGVSTGWVLEVVSGKVAVCGLGALSKWDPANPSVRHISVPVGWYGIDVWLGASSINGDDFTLEIVMSRSATKPLFSADVTKNFSEERA